jgi:hypothetical protein
LNISTLFLSEAKFTAILLGIISWNQAIKLGSLFCFKLALSNVTLTFSDMALRYLAQFRGHVASHISDATKTSVTGTIPIAIYN